MGQHFRVRLLLAVALLRLGLASPAGSSSPDAAASLSPLVAGDDNWEEVIHSSPLVLVGFFAPW